MVIGICTFNRGPKLIRTLETLAAMDLCNGRVTRLMVIDNNSTDQTGIVVDAFAATSTHLKVARIVETTQGLAAARERLIHATTEPIVAFIDDDCLPDVAWAAAILSSFDRHPRAGMTGGRVSLSWESGPTVLARRCATMLAAQDLGPREFQLVEPEHCLVGAAFAVRRSAVNQSGWLERRSLTDREGNALTSGGDFEMGIRIRRAGWELWYSPEPSVQHLIPPERQTAAYLQRLMRGVSLSKAALKWLAHGEPGVEWAVARARKARRRRVKSMLLEWRPSHRALKLAEHQARCEGWASLVNALQSQSRNPAP